MKKAFIGIDPPLSFLNTFCRTSSRYSTTTGTDMESRCGGILDSLTAPRIIICKRTWGLMNIWYGMGAAAGRDQFLRPRNISMVKEADLWLIMRPCTLRGTVCKATIPWVVSVYFINYECITCHEQEQTWVTQGEAWCPGTVSSSIYPVSASL